MFDKFRVNNKDTRTNFTTVSIVSIVDFEHVCVCWEKLIVTKSLPFGFDLVKQVYRAVVRATIL